MTVAHTITNQIWTRGNAPACKLQPDRGMAGGWLQSVTKLQINSLYILMIANDKIIITYQLK